MQPDVVQVQISMSLLSRCLLPSPGLPDQDLEWPGLLGQASSHLPFPPAPHFQ